MNSIRSGFFSILNFLKNFPKKHWKLLLFLIIIFSLIGFWQYKKIQNNKPVLTWQKAERKNLTKNLEISGVVDAKERVKMRFLAGGKVTYIGAKEGDFVKKWQTIAAIDKATLQKSIAQDLNDYMAERWDFDQYKADYKDWYFDKTIIRTNNDNQLDLNNVVFDVEITDLAIKNTNLYAPFDGILIQSPTAVTNVQLLATDYFEIINPKTLVFKAIVDELDIGLVNLDKTAQIELDAYKGEIINTQVSYISYTSGQAATGTVFIVELPLNSEDIKKYRLGMNGDVKIKLEEKNNVLAIPLDATISKNGETFVNVRLEKDKYEERKIKVGLETEDEVEILEGLKENDEILLPE